MKQEHKYFVEWSLDGYGRRGDIVLGVELSITERTPYIKDYIQKYYEGITKAGTKVVIQSVTYMGTVLRISE